ncbi:MAG: tetratricopeptide repeat protein, partial [bacterium]|nr:tetratricopeptide repeat protein [bacterium]
EELLEEVKEEVPVTEQPEQLEDKITPEEKAEEAVVEEQPLEELLEEVKEEVPVTEQPEQLEDKIIPEEKPEEAVVEEQPLEELVEEVKEEVPVTEQPEQLKDKIIPDEEEIRERIITETLAKEAKEKKVKEKKVKPIPAPKIPKPKKEKIPITPFLKKGLKILLLGIGVTTIFSLSYPTYLFFYMPYKHFNAGLSYIQTKDFNKAEEEFKEGLNSTRLKAAQVDAYNRFGLAYLKIKDYKKAEGKFNEAARIAPTDPVSKNNLVNLYIKKGDLKKSEEMCEEILKKHPQNIPAYVNLSKVLLLTSRPQGAIKCLKYALAINKKDVSALSLYQHALAHTGKYRDALSIHRYLYQITKEKHLYYPDDLTDIGNIYLKKGDLTTSVDVFNRVLKHYPNHGRARFSLSMLLLKEHKVNEAIQELEKTIKYNPDYDKPYVLLGKTYYDKKIYDKALLRFRKASISNPKNGEAHEGMGNVYYYNLNAYSPAAISYTNALKNGRNSPQIKYNSGVSLYKTNQFDKSLKIWEDLGDAPTIKFNLATTQVQLHNFDQAKQIYGNLMDFYKEKLKAGVRLQEKREICQQISLIHNNLGVMTELQEGGQKALTSYWQALEFASLANGENKPAYDNLNRVFNLEELKSVQGLSDVQKIYKIEEKPKAVIEKPEETHHPSEATHHVPEETHHLPKEEHKSH